MSVAGHLGIRLAEYDSRIRGFIPYYEEILREAASALSAVRARRPTVLDLGIGTGALAARCLEALPGAAFIGIDADGAILEAARRRLARDLGDRLTLVHANFLDTPLPRCDAIVASFALHHVATPRRKRRLYEKCHAALSRGGVLVNADRMTATDPWLIREERAAWKAHLARRYGATRAGSYLRAWAREDVYLPLARELDLVRHAGFDVDVPWRRGGFAVVVGRKRGTA